MISSRVSRALPVATMIVAAVSCSSTPVMESEPPMPHTVLVDVAFATDRNIEDPSSVENRYGVLRDVVTYGVCNVAVNTRKQRRTGHSNPVLWPPAPKNSKRKAGLSWIGEMDVGAFDEALSARLRRSGEQSAILYIHGYSEKFREAAEDLAGLIYELSYPGVPVLYSWPSRGHPASYSSDKASLDWSTPHLRAFLQDLMRNQDLETLHVIAHSLGNRALINAFMDLLADIERAEEWKFGEIVLVAPDFDAAIFERDVAPALVHDRSRVTLYVSSLDVPLQASQSLNLYPRLGNAKPQVTIVPEVETVDVTEASKVTRGHSYHLASEETLSDLYFLINQRLGADQRPTLQAVESANGRYWKIREEF